MALGRGCPRFLAVFPANFVHERPRPQSLFQSGLTRLACHVPTLHVHPRYPALLRKLETPNKSSCRLLQRRALLTKRKKPSTNCVRIRQWRKKRSSIMMRSRRLHYFLHFLPRFLRISGKCLISHPFSPLALPNQRHLPYATVHCLRLA